MAQNNAEFNKIIGERIKFFRKRLGLTQEEVAQQLFMSSAWLSKVEKGITALGLGYVAQLADVLQVDPVNFSVAAEEIDDMELKKGLFIESFDDFLQKNGFAIVHTLRKEPKWVYSADMGGNYLPDGAFTDKTVICYPGENGREKRCVLDYESGYAFYKTIMETIKKNLDMLSDILPQDLGISEEEFAALREEQK